MFKRSVAVSILLSAAALGAHAEAQSIDSPYRFVEHSQSIYPFGGAVFTDRGSLDVGPGSGYGAGLGYTIRVSGPFNIGLRATYLPTDRRVYTDNSTVADSASLRDDPLTGLEQVGTAALDLLLLDASLRFDITGPRTWYRLQPYALLGVGGVLVVASDNASEDNLPTDRELRVRFRNGFTGHVGAGVEFHLSERFSARVEGRDLLWRLSIPSGFVTTGRLLGENEWVQTAHVMLGLSVRF